MNRWNLLPIFLSMMVALVFSANLVKRQAARISWPPVGVPGVDYPTYSEVPSNLNFDCREKLPGYYADPEAQCQVWHWCVPSGQRYSFLCPNGTMFNQNYRVCDWWYNVKCSDSASLYGINADLYKDAKGNPL